MVKGEWKFAKLLGVRRQPDAAFIWHMDERRVMAIRNGYRRSKAASRPPQSMTASVLRLPLKSRERRGVRRQTECDAAFIWTWTNGVARGIHEELAFESGVTATAVQDGKRLSRALK